MRLAMTPSLPPPADFSHCLASSSFLLAGERRNNVLAKQFAANSSSSCRRFGELCCYQVHLSTFQKIEREKQSGRLQRQSLDAARGGMDALKQRIERKFASYLNDQLTVENKASFGQQDCGIRDLRKIAREFVARFRCHRDFLAVTREKAAEAIPFWLILPLVADRYLVDRPCLHRLDLFVHVGPLGRRECTP